MAHDKVISTDRDKALLDLLRANARMSVSDLAKALGLSRTTAQARLQRLERDHVILGYTIVQRKNENENRTINAIVMMEIEARAQPELLSHMRRMPQVSACSTVSGAYDICVMLKCQNPEDLDNTLDRLAAIKGVRKTTSSVVLARKIG